MNMRARNVAWLLPFLLTGCFGVHKTQPPPAQALAPPPDTLPKPPATHPDLPPSAVNIPLQPIKSDAGTAIGQTPTPPARHRRQPKNTQQAANTQPAAPENPGVSAIGQLSSGDPSDLRRTTSDSIAATERGLSAVTRPLNESEQNTAAQIKEYLKQARQALDSGDVDGANTLAAKAKVLLGELNQ